MAELCTALAEAVARQDEGAAQKAFKDIVQEVDRAEPAQLTEALQALRPALAETPLGNGAPLAALAGGLVEAGGDPAGALDVLAERIAAGLEQAARFPGSPAPRCPRRPTRRPRTRWWSGLPPPAGSASTRRPR